jgi:citrate lyase subunit alpha / citrate CoA-transferase
MAANERHAATSPFTSYNYHGKGNFASMVDAVVLGATEVDTNFNANVVTHSDGRLLHGIGGWQNCFAAKMHSPGGAFIPRSHSGHCG